MQNVTRMCGILAIAGAMTALGACGDDAKRPIGETCSDNEECQGGVCGGGVCLDPADDEDGDGLINGSEVKAKTDPVAPDSDLDQIADGLEVGTDPAHPKDSDGDGRIDAKESAIADCDGDQQVDQSDATDGLAADGKCPAQVVVSPCVKLCDRASFLQCEGASVGCLSDCSAAFTALDNDCRAKMAGVGNCILETDASTCADEGTPSWQILPPNDQCGEELGGFTLCLESLPVCPEPSVLTLEQRVEGTLELSGGMAVYSAHLEADKNYEFDVTAPGSTDNVRLLVFASETDGCAWIANPDGGVVPLGESGGEAGFDRTAQVGSSANARDVFVVLVNERADGGSSYTLIGQELGI